MMTKEELKKTAALAKLYIDDTQLAAEITALAKLKGFAEKIAAAEIDLDILSEQNAFMPASAAVNAMRGDIIEASLPNEVLLQNSGSAAEGFFYIAKSAKEKRI